VPSHDFVEERPVRAAKEGIIFIALQPLRPVRPKQPMKKRIPQFPRRHLDTDALLGRVPRNIATIAIEL
jgi:hypothetical protein